MADAKTMVAVRRATAADAKTMIELIIGLARYEKLDPPDEPAQQRLLNDAFGPKPRIEVWLADVNGKPSGYAILLETYSSFLALPTLYLEDIFVTPESRGCGAGMALFSKCVEEADRRGCGRVEFVVLDWNRPARDFYERLGVTHLDNWCCYRLTRDKFAGLLAPPPRADSAPGEARATPPPQ
jgi:GNAT superfamily N-acetyltransferase